MTMKHEKGSGLQMTEYKTRFMNTPDNLALAKLVTFVPNNPSSISKRTYKIIKGADELEIIELTFISAYDIQCFHNLFGHLWLR